MITSQVDCNVWIATGVVEIEDNKDYTLGVRQLIVRDNKMDFMG